MRVLIFSTEQDVELHSDYIESLLNFKLEAMKNDGYKYYTIELNTIEDLKN